MRHVRGFGGFDSDPTLKKRNRIRIRRSRKKIDLDLNPFNFDPVLFFINKGSRKKGLLLVAQPKRPYLPPSDFF